MGVRRRRLSETITSSNSSENIRCIPLDHPALKERFLLEERMKKEGVPPLEKEKNLPHFASNVVISAKYTLWNFVPKVLYAQIKKPSNIYFLFIAVLQSIREVSNTNGVPTILLPLTIVFICSAIKEALEDRERHKADKVTNSKTILALNAMGEWENKLWGDICVGDIVKVLNDQTIPADLFMLNVEADQTAKKPLLLRMPSDQNDVGKSNTKNQKAPTSNGVCYVETKSLDGETNLKIRSVISTVAAFSCEQQNLQALRGVIECEPPNNRISSFEGYLSLYIKQEVAENLGVRHNSASFSSNGAGSGNIGGIVSGGSGGTDNYQTTIRADDSISVKIPITAKQMLLRSCVLRNTHAITGIAIFTGHETKVFCSNTDPIVKTSSVEQRLNSLIIGVVMIQQIICFLGALLGAYWMITKGSDYWYLGFNTADSSSSVSMSDSGRKHVVHVFPFEELIKLHLRYFIIMQNFVPISLNVSLEFVKYWQAYFIEQDLEMYDAASDTSAIVRSSALNEDLGRVHHIFTDKTGTLTMNLMLFRYCLIDGQHYGGLLKEEDFSSQEAHEMSTQQQQDGGIRYVEFDPSQLFTDLNKTESSRAQRIRLFLRHLALCHTLIPSKSFEEMCDPLVTPEYSASSPDELALVAAAAFCNVRFVYRTPETIILLEPSGTSSKGSTRTYKILHVLEFDSDRKRMSIILKSPEGDIELFCKGADNVILERLAPLQMYGYGPPEEGSDIEMNMASGLDSVYTQLSLYARRGMRTLCIAYKKLDLAQYLEWQEKYRTAHGNMDELVRKRQGLANAIDPLMNEIEQDLQLLGVTAVQDKLQQGVPRTLKMLQETNMKIWTLTGDKMETAVNIGFACNLLSNDMEIKQLQGEDYVSAMKALKDLISRYRGDDENDSLTGEKIRLSLGVTALSMGNNRLTRKSKKKRIRTKQSMTLLERVRLFWEQNVYGLHQYSHFGQGGKTGKRKKQQRQRRSSSSFRARRSLKGQSKLLSPFSSIWDLSEEERERRERPAIDPTDRETETEDDEIYRSREGGGAILGTSELDLLQRQRLLSQDQNESSGPCVGLVIDGATLECALHIPRLRNTLYKASTLCRTVICCRVSPKQKADLVEWIRSNEPESITLAIGDGANDVGMIQAAHIGIGISGQEGTQAVNSSDYAIAQFRFLQKLLFVHGRWAYRRVSKLMSFMLYKNVTYVLTTFWFGSYCGFSGQPLILDIAAQTFNVIYTSLPLVLFAVLDQDVSASSAFNFPRLYILGQKNMLLTRRVFWPWIWNGVWHSLVIFFGAAWGFQMGSISADSSLFVASSDGLVDDYVTLGFVVFTCLVIVVNLKLCLEAFCLTYYFMLTVFVSILLWYFVGNWIDHPSISKIVEAVGVFEYLQRSAAFWFVTLLIVTCSLMRDFGWKMFKRIAFPTLYHILQERELLFGERKESYSLDDEEDEEGDEDEGEESKATGEEEERGSNGTLLKSFVASSTSTREAIMRSSPLGENLIPKTKGKWYDEKEEEEEEEEKETKDQDVFSPTVRPSMTPHLYGVHAGSGSDYLSDSGGGRGKRSYREQYHGYAFSEDENVDSDVELASILSPRTGHSSSSSNTSKMATRSTGLMSTSIISGVGGSPSPNSVPNTAPGTPTHSLLGGFSNSTRTTKHQFIKPSAKKPVKNVKNA